MTTPTGHYRSSTGELKKIATMNPFNLLNAAKNLAKDCPPDREAELAEMQAQVATNAVNYRAELAAERPTATPERQAKIDEILAKMDAEA